MRSSFMLIASLGMLTALSVGSVEAAGRGGGGGPPSFAAGGGGPPTGPTSGPTAGPTAGPTFSNGDPPGFSSEGKRTGFENGEPRGWTEGKKKGWNCTLSDPDCGPPGLKGR